MPAPRLLQILRVVFVLLLVGALSACSAKNNPETFFDPHEADNRKIHAFNKSLDRAVLRPVSVGYGAVVGEEGNRAVTNFVDNLGMPRRFVNQVLQGKLVGATQTVLRFAINSTMGLGGLTDAASGFGLPDEDTNFGETLHVWGFGEGAYVELPVLGPSTERDTVGLLVDTALDPLGRFLPQNAQNTVSAARIVERVGDRWEYSSTLDNLYYETEDSYAAARQFYLQNRRFNLNKGIDISDLEDPYAD